MIHSKGEIHNPANIGVVIIGYLLLESLFFATFGLCRQPNSNPSILLPRTTSIFETTMRLQTSSLLNSKDFSLNLS